MKLSTAGLKGPLTKSVNVRSNDPKTPNLRLTVHGNVSVPAAFAEPWLRLGKVARGELIERTVALEVADPARFEVLELTSSHPEVIVPELVAGPDGKLAVKVAIHVPDRAGPLNGVVNVQTNLEKVPQLVLRIAGSVP